MAQNGGDICWSITKGASLVWPDVLPQMDLFAFQMPTNHLGASPGGLSSRLMLSLDSDGNFLVEGGLMTRRAKPLHRMLCAWLYCIGSQSSLMPGGNYRMEPGRGGENGRHGRLRFQGPDGRDLLRIEEGGFYADQTYLTTKGKVVDAFCSWLVALQEAGLRDPGLTPAPVWP